VPAHQDSGARSVWHARLATVPIPQMRGKVTSMNTDVANDTEEDLDANDEDDDGVTIDDDTAKEISDDDDTPG